MWTLIQTETSGGNNKIGYIDANNPECGIVTAMYRIDKYGELDFYYQYEMDDDVVASFERWAKRGIGEAKNKKDNVTKCADCCYLGDKYSFPLHDNKIDVDDKNPFLKHYYCCCGDSERYEKDVTNEIVSDSITMAMPSDSITIQVTDTDSIARQQEADKNLLSLLETDSTEQILPVIKMLRMLEYADSIRAMQGSGEIPVNPLFLPIVFEKQMSTPFQHLPSAEKCPFKPKSLSVDDKWLQDEIQAEKTRNLAQNYVIVNYPKLIHYNTDNLPEVPKQYVIENDPAKHILSIKEKPLIIKNDVGKEKIKLKRWIINFQSSIQFSQVYVSENWYQGGTSNVNLLSDQQFSIKYNDPKDVDVESLSQSKYISGVILSAL